MNKRIYILGLMIFLTMTSVAAFQENISEAYVLLYTELDSSHNSRLFKRTGFPNALVQGDKLFIKKLVALNVGNLSSNEFIYTIKLIPPQNSLNLANVGINYHEYKIFIPSLPPNGRFEYIHLNNKNYTVYLNGRKNGTVTHRPITLYKSGEWGLVEIVPPKVKYGSIFKKDLYKHFFSVTSNSEYESYRNSMLAVIISLIMMVLTLLVAILSIGIELKISKDTIGRLEKVAKNIENTSEKQIQRRELIETKKEINILHAAAQELTQNLQFSKQFIDNEATYTTAQENLIPMHGFLIAALHNVIRLYIIQDSKLNADILDIFIFFNMQNNYIQTAIQHPATAKKAMKAVITNLKGDKENLESLQKRLDEYIKSKIS